MSGARVAAAAAAAVLAGGGGGALTVATGHAAQPARPATTVATAHAAPPAVTVGVGLREWSVALYRPRVRVGVVVIKATNRGEDAHDLQVRGPRGYRSPTSPVIASLGRGELRVRLTRPGRYRVVCTLPGHERLGMHAVLRVTRAAG